MTAQMFGLGGREEAFEVSMIPKHNFNVVDANNLPESCEQASRERANLSSIRETARAMEVNICASAKFDVFSERKHFVSGFSRRFSGASRMNNLNN